MKSVESCQKLQIPWHIKRKFIYNKLWRHIIITHILKIRRSYFEIFDNRVAKKISSDAPGERFSDTYFTNCGVLRRANTNYSMNNNCNRKVLFLVLHCRVNVLFW
jgi:hypothetical protein